jgi:hypothetical protein
MPSRAVLRRVPARLAGSAGRIRPMQLFNSAAISIQILDIKFLFSLEAGFADGNVACEQSPFYRLLTIPWLHR